MTEPEFLRNHFDAAKADSPQHGLDRRAIRSAPISRVIIELIAGVESYHGPIGHHAIDMGVEDQLAFRYAKDPLQGEKWITHVIEHPKAQNQIELADPFRAQFHDVDVQVFDFGIEDV